MRRFCDELSEASGCFFEQPKVLALSNYYHFRPRSDKFMNRIFNFVFPPALVLVAMFVSLPAVASAQDFAPPAAGWPDDNASFANVDHAVQKANYEFESMTGNVSQALQDSPASELLNKMQPMADDLTQSFKQKAGSLLDSDKAKSWVADIKQAVGGADIGKVFSSLAIVLGGYFGFVWLMRKVNPAGSLGLPQEVVEVLGQTSFGGKKNLQLVRLGSKLLLLMNSAEGTKTIGEITDPAEVEYLASLCGAGRSTKSVLRRQKTQMQSRSQIQSQGQTHTVPSTHGPVVSTPQVPQIPQVSGDLKQIIQQLRNVADKTAGSIFEA